MRSKISKKILDETPQEVKDKVNNYTNELLMRSAQKYLDRIENRGIDDPFTYSRKEMVDFAEKYHKEQLRIGDVSQQRELLNGFRQWLINEKKNINIYPHLIDEYLKTKY